MGRIGGGRYLALAGIVLFLSLHAAGAATRTWTGGSVSMPGSPNDFWTNQFNWSPNAIPSPGDDLVLVGGVQLTSTNAFPSGTNFNTLSLGGGHVAIGAGITLNAGLTSTEAQISFSSIKLINSQTFTASQAGTSLIITSAIDNNARTLTLNGPGSLLLTGAISGLGGLIKSGTGTGMLVVANSYSGPTTVNDGALLIFGSQPGSSITIVNGVLGGSGTVGAISFANTHGNLAPGSDKHGAGTLSVNGNVAFPLSGTSDSYLSIDLLGTNPGSEYDQLNVTGTVNVGLGNRLNVMIQDGFSPVAGDTFIIINNDGNDPIVGHFDGAEEGAIIPAGETILVLSYKGGDGNDLTLSVPRNSTWDGGGGDNKWSTAANWAGDVAPQPEDSLVFPPSAARLSNMNDFPAGTSFHSITFTGNGYHLAGNGIILHSGISDLNTGDNSIDFGTLTLDSNQSFSTDGGSVSNALSLNSDINLGSATLTLASIGAAEQTYSGIISSSGAAGGIVKTGAGPARLQGNAPVGLPPANNYTSDTTILAGTLIVTASQPGSKVTVQGGTLAGSGTVGGITAVGGDVQPWDGGPRTIKVAGNVMLNPGVEFEVLLGRSGTQLMGGRLDVTGQVDLNSATLRVDLTGETPQPGDEFVIIQNNGGGAVNGNFNNLAEGSVLTAGGISFTISYRGGDSNDVVLRTMAVPPGATPGVLGNIATRLRVESGDNVLIGGFIVTGTQPKKVLVRALGPSLAQLFNGALSNPTLELYQGGSLLATNDNWKDTQRSEIEATTIPPANDLESAILVTLPANNSSYTAVVRGAGGETGIAIVEVYDLDRTVASKLGNISTRGFVQTGDNVLIGGLIVLGQNPLKVIVRAIGPSLTGAGIAGALADPALELRDQNGSLLASNDNWRSTQEAEIQATSIAPANDLESAIVATLPANGAGYTAIVRGANGATGIAVVEVYALN